MKLLEEIVRLVPVSFFSLVALGVVATGRGAPALDAVAPPWLPDERYVANGCYLSAIAYIAKLQERYPGVAAHPVNVRFSDGQLHTVTAVRWGNRLFLRDIYIGVAPLSEDAQASFDAALAAWNVNEGGHVYPERRPHSRADRKHEVELAANLIAFAKPQIIPVESAKGRVSVLSWRTAEGELAIYEPLLGTAVGRSSRPPAVVARQLLDTVRGTGIVDIPALARLSSGRHHE